MTRQQLHARLRKLGLKAAKLNSRGVVRPGYVVRELGDGHFLFSWIGLLHVKAIPANVHETLVGAGLAVEDGPRDNLIVSEARS